MKNSAEHSHLHTRKFWQCIKNVMKIKEKKNMCNLFSLLLFLNSLFNYIDKKRLSRVEQINDCKNLRSFIFKIQNHLLCLHLVPCCVSYLFEFALCIQLSAISMRNNSLGKYLLVPAHWRAEYTQFHWTVMFDVSFIQGFSRVASASP